MIEWDGIGLVFSKLSQQDQNQRMKIIHQYLPTKSILHDRNNDVRAICLQCTATKETFDHIFQCQCSQNQISHRNAPKKLKNTLQKIHSN